MKKFWVGFLAFCLASLANTARANPPLVWGQRGADLLQPGICDSGEGGCVLFGSLNPTSTAVDAPKGSLYISSTGTVYLKNDNGSTTNWTTFGTSGATVTSVALTAPAWLTVGGSPVTSSGTLALTGTSETGNEVLASPNGSSGAMTPRALVGADLPLPGTSSLGGVESLACASHEWLNDISTSGVPACTQPQLTDLSGVSVTGNTLKLASSTGTLTSGDCVKIDASGNLVDAGAACGTSAGTVSSVALTMPSWLTVSGSPVTTSGTLAVTGTSESQNLFLASPNGSSGAMTPRAIVGADLPATVVQTNQANTYTAGPQSLGTQVETVQLPNDNVTGTTIHKLAKFTSSGTAIIMATSDSTGALGVVAAGPGTSGNADIAQLGQTTCDFDGSTTAGDYVEISSTTAGDCHDSGGSLPGSGQIVGRVLSSNVGAGAYSLALFLPSVAGSGSSGTVSSVNATDGSTSPIFSWSGGPITGAGTLTETLSTQAKNLIFAGPSSGANAQPNFRPAVEADLPSTTVFTDTANTYTAGPQSLGSQTMSAQLSNDGSTGTTLHKLAKINSSGNVVIMATSDTSGAFGVVAAGAGTSGKADIAQLGQASCVFDGATTSGDYATISSSTAGDCHDYGSSAPTNGDQAVGRVLTTNASGGTYAMELLSGGGGGATPPGGSSTDVQYNSSGSFAGDSGMTYDGAGNLTLSAKINATTVKCTNCTASTPAVLDSSTDLASGSVSAPLAFSGGAFSLGFNDSLVNNGGNLQLSGDSAAPGDSFYYGTNASGTKGWYTLPAGTLYTASDSIALTGSNFTLTNDSAAPGNNMFYGTNGSGTLGWYSSFVNPMTALGDIITGGSSGASTRLAGNTSTQAEVLTSQGTGSAAQAPSWQPVSAIGISTDWSSALSNSFTFGGLGTVSGQSIYTRRVGDTLEVKGTVTAGTVSGNVEIILPSGYVIDSTKLSSSNPGVALGYAHSAISSSEPLFNGSTFAGGAQVVFYDGSTTSGVFLAYQSGSNVFTKGASVNNNALISFQFSAPISGWSSNTIGASQGAVYASYGVTTGATTSTSTPINFDTRIQDTGALTGTPICVPATSAFKCTAPVSGSYTITGQIYTTGSSTNVSLYKNGTAFTSITGVPATTQSTPIAMTLSLNAGDYVNIRSDNQPFSTQGFAGRWYDIFNFSLNSGNGSGNVTSSGAGQYHTESATVASVCSSGNCTLSGPYSPWLTSISWQATGEYDLNFESGEFSSGPLCFFTYVNGAGAVASAIKVSSSSSAYEVQFNNGGSVNVAFDVMCMGPH